MLRRVMAAFVALMLVATLFMPLASVGAQEEVDPGAAPVTTEQTQPESEPSVVDTEPPVTDAESDAPIVEPPVDETQPEAPAVDDMEQTAAGEANDPASDGSAPASGDEATTIEAAADTEVEPSDEESPTVIENLTIDCTGLLTYDVVEAHGEELGVLIKTTDPNVATGPEGDIDGFILFINSEGHSSSTVDISGNPGNVFVTINSSAVGGPIAESPIATCHEIAEPEPDTDPDPDEAGPASVISSVSVTCDGSVTFTISEAHGETLRIAVTDPRAPSPHDDLASGSFEATEAGTFTLDFEIDARDTVRATISSLSSNNYASAFVPNCLTEDEEIEADIVSNLTVTCDGDVSLTANDAIVGMSAGLHLYGSNGSSWQSIGVAPLPFSGAITREFDIPAGVWDSLRIEATAKWSLLGAATVSGCLDEETPDPVLPVVEHLSADCTGFVSFDLDASEAVELQVWAGTPAQAPGFHAETFVTLASGHHQVRLDIPVGRFDRHTVLVALDTDEWHQLAETVVTGCRDQTATPNTAAGSGVEVEIGGIAVGFDYVNVPGVTTVTMLEPEQAPALPAEFDPESAILLDISTTAVFEGAARICVPVGASFGDMSAAHLLHFENGTWIDITTSVDPTSRTICGVTSSFSPFAVVKLAGQEPDRPNEPGASESPGRHAPKPTGNGSIPNGLPNTGSGLQPTGGSQTLPLILGMLMLIAAGGLRLNPTRTRGTNSR